VKLAATEGLGAFWLAPRLAEFHRSHPKLLVDLRCAMRPVDMLRLEADAAVQLIGPAEADLKVVKLGRLHILPYAASSYLEAHGVPASLEDLRRHRLVFQIGEQTAAPELTAAIFGDRSQTGLVSVRTNSSSAHALAIASGAGIGWLATYASAVTTGLVPIDLAPRCTFDIRLTYHPDVAGIPRVRHVIDWVIASFDPRRYPWFRDEFVHPSEFATVYRGEPLFNVSGHFAEDEVPFIELPDLMLMAGGRARAG
jgi:DNA-binding transcriptional LysR family regulator